MNPNTGDNQKINGSNDGNTINDGRSVTQEDDETIAAIIPAPDVDQKIPELYSCPTEISNKLNVAYEALEKMRRLNLEVECHENGISHDKIEYDMCTTCMMANQGSDSQSHFPRLQRWMDSANTTILNSSSSVLSSTTTTDFRTLTEIEADDNINQPSSTTTNGRTEIESNTNLPAVEKNVSPQALSTSTATVETISSTSMPYNTDYSSSVSQNDSTNEESTSKESITAIMSTEAAVAFASNPPPSQTNIPEATSASFPRMRNLWSTSFSATSTLTARTSASLTTPISTSSPSFPRIRGLINNSVTSGIFGDNQISNRAITSSDISSSHNSYSASNSASIKSAKPIALPRIQKLIDQRTKANTHPCLICASPSCSSHSSASFRREGITLCLQCERLFELDFIVDCVSAPDATQRAERINYMIDCYDRCMLLIQYSMQFVSKIAMCLENQKEQQNKIGLASSSVGVLSGVLGIAAAASILTPAGPPLLIASLFFGGSASTVQTGSEAMNYFSEPRKLADRIIALHGILRSILRVTNTLRDAMLRDHIRTDVYEAVPIPIKNQMKESLEKNKTAVIAGSNIGRSITLGGLAGAEAGAASVVVAGSVAAGEVSVVSGSVVGASAAAGASASATGVSAATGAGAAGARSATALSRAGTAAARTVRFARFAGGALSAAVLVMEANSIQCTLKSIKEGSPCDKAETLRKVRDEIDDFPSTNELDDECQAYLAALATRPPPTAEAAAFYEESNKNDLPEATCEEFANGQDNQLCAPGTVIMNDVDNLGTPTSEGQQPAVVPITNSSFLGGSSLFQRIRSRQEERQSLAASTAEEVVAVVVDDDQLEESNYNLVV
mmetsp:Transcript_1426/g.1621  ORF Transcript_1426/g.1621 Transcript_1426/m.1621 type:complete len:847 (+) Transcript_1426:47-2587(+)